MDNQLEGLAQWRKDYDRYHVGEVPIADEAVTFIDRLQSELAMLRQGRARLLDLVKIWRERATVKMRWTNHPDAEPAFIHSYDVRVTLDWCADELAGLLHEDTP